MLAKRIIPCLDVKDGKVVKGVQFKKHQILGDVLDLACRYRDQGADELVFYDITASAENRTISPKWVEDTARVLDIPFCVAGGIRSVDDARQVLNAGADKISVNSPALERPQLIQELATAFGVQCVVVGVDSRFEDDDYVVYQYTGSEKTMCRARKRTVDWIVEAQALGAGEIVLNCINRDGMQSGYDIKQLQKMRRLLSIPLIASGGAAEKVHFADVFQQARVDGALAAGVFHRGELDINDLKTYLNGAGIVVRPNDQGALCV